VRGCFHEAKWAEAAGIDRRLPRISLQDGGFSKPDEAGREQARSSSNTMAARFCEDAHGPATQAAGFS